jgi:cytochrome c5
MHATQRRVGNAIAVVLVAGLVLTTACGQAAPAAPTAAPASALSQWEQETLAAAQKEGKVVVYGFWNPTLEQMVTGFMAQRYPGLKL